MTVQAMRKMLQEVEHIVDTSADPLRHAAVPLPVLWKTVPSEIRHEKTYIHTYG